MKICLVGEGAQGETHMQVISDFDDIEVMSVAGGIAEDLAIFAERWNIPHHSLDLEECLAQPGIEAVINTGPSQMHASQTELCIEAGKHVLLEVPMALSVSDARRLSELEGESGLTCMVCHTRHYNPPLRELRRMIREDELHVHQVVMQTYFFRRENLNRFGQPRTWKDDLLWHHGCHAVDMFRWLMDDDDLEVWGQVGPNHSSLDIPMDLSIGLKSHKTGAIATIAHSFNNHGPIMTPIRIIAEEETYTWQAMLLTNHDDLVVAKTSMPEAVALQDREFLDAIAQRRRPETSFHDALQTMELLDKIQQQIDKRQ
jgi:2-hydroxy-4-carboxymuconate semialdehyde hemiacetal dehydrogenase